MNTVGIKELKNRLPHYIRRVRSGEEIIVTDRDRPVALIQKIDIAKVVSSEAAIIGQMAAEGAITLPKRKGPFLKVKPIKIRGESASQIIVEDRRSSRY